MKNRLKEIRKANNLTMEKFGERIGLKKTAISQMENGVTNVSERNIKSICREFNINERWLRTGEGSMNVELTRNQELQMLVNNILREQDESFKKDFTTALLKMSPEGWNALEQFLKDFNEIHSK